MDSTNVRNCQECKKNLELDMFKDEEKEEKYYSKCQNCRNKINFKNKKNFCEICVLSSAFNFKGEKSRRFCKEHSLPSMIDIVNKKCIKCKIKQPSFNLPTEKVAIYCSGCTETGMIDIKNKKCIKCKVKRPNFNLPTEKVATHCASCSEPGMINIVNKKCIKCKVKRSHFNLPTEKVATYCAGCAKPGMINILNKKCVKCKSKQPSFNLLTEKVAIYCGDCKEPGMIDIKNKKCIKCKTKIPSFNLPTETIATHCAGCAEPGMINIKDKKCSKCKTKQPTFNLPTETIATHCGDCKEPGMIDIINKKCIKCKIRRPTFNLPTETIATHCRDCKEPGMIDIINKKCVECKSKQPSYNLPTEKGATHCAGCAAPGMVNVKNKKCVNEICKTLACYGYCGQSVSFCAKHRDKHPDKNWLYFRPKRTCIGDENEDCKEIATYGITEPKHCEEHSIEDEIYLIAQKCKKCDRNDLLNREGICISYCQPDQLYQQTKQEKVKEMTTLNYLDKYVKDLQVVSDDRQIPNSCGIKNRPDRIYDCGSHYLIIEVDEGQHKSTRSSCSRGEQGELARMHNIQLALGMNCIFLRFNPDNFRVDRKLQKINMNERLKLLVKWIEKCKEMKPEKELEPVKYKYLFYDGFDETDITFNIIDDLELNKE